MGRRCLFTPRPTKAPKRSAWPLSSSSPGASCSAVLASPQPGRARRKQAACLPRGLVGAARPLPVRKGSPILRTGRAPSGRSASPDPQRFQDAGAPPSDHRQSRPWAPPGRRKDTAPRGCCVDRPRGVGRGRPLALWAPRALRDPGFGTPAPRRGSGAPAPQLRSLSLLTSPALHSLPRALRLPEVASGLSSRLPRRATPSGRNPFHLLAGPAPSRWPPCPQLLLPRAGLNLQCGYRVPSLPGAWGEGARAHDTRDTDTDTQTHGHMHTKTHTHRHRHTHAHTQQSALFSLALGNLIASPRAVPSDASTSPF